MTPATRAQTQLSAEERELLHVLVDDVGVLESRLLLGRPSPQDARAVFAPILRKWIVEGTFHKVQKLIGPDKVRFISAGNAQAIRLCKAGILEHWMALIVFDGMGIGVGLIAKKHLLVKPVLPPPSAAVPQLAKHFFDQKMVYWKGNFYTRSDVVKWLANKFGGTHLDFRRKDDEAHINELKNYFGFEVTQSNYQMLVGEEIAVGRADAARRPRIYDTTELITIDTAQIFAAGIRAAMDSIGALLEVKVVK